MSYNNRRPFSAIVHKSKKIISGQVDFMITRAPWADPVNKYFVLRKARVVNSQGSGVGDTVFWDQDLSSATPTKRGSAGGALYVVPGGNAPLSGVFSSASKEDIDNTPPVPFYAGITCRADINSYINLELELV